jgi:putative DNA primase/helicase
MRRHTAASPCAVCTGYESMPRGQGKRCAGFTSDDGAWVHCEREEHAGSLPLDERTTPPTYLHRIGGPCNCGDEHAPAMATPTGRAHTPRQPSRRIVATYLYTDASGCRVAYRVARFEPKGFLPQHPTEAGAWANGFASEERVPLRGALPRPAPGRGAAWREGLRQALGGRPADDDHGRRREVLPQACRHLDNDDDGRAYAAEVAGSLVAVGAGVRLVELPGLPAKGDVSDWLDAGHTVEELRELVKVAPRWEPPTAEDADTGDQRRPNLQLVPASSVKPERVSWAWDQRIPVGMASLIVGQGGLGKSLQLCWLAAGWSRGTVPGDFHGTPVDVAIASAEDHRQAVILPRLLAAGADLSRIHFIEQINADGDADDIAINGEVDALERVLVAGAVRVLLIDTVIAHIPAQHDTYNEQRVRAVLKPLKKMAERNDQVVLGVMHLNRRETRDVLTRISGSGGFGNLARSVLLFAPDPDDPDGLTRILAIGKSNVGGVADTLKLRLEPCLVPGDDGGEISTVRLVDSGTSTYTSSQLLAVPADDEERHAGTEAEEFLRELLANGPVEAQTVMRQRRDAGISEITLRRAAKRVGVKTNDREGFGAGYPSRWSLLDQKPPTCSRQTDEQVGTGRSSREHVTLSDTPPDGLPSDPVAAILTAFPGAKHTAHYHRDDPAIVRLRELAALNAYTP